MRVLALYGSSRRQGNTDQLTDIALSGIPATKIYLSEKKIIPIADGRHAPGGFLPVDDDYDDVVSAMLTHDVTVFATPVYWYGMSGPMKNFIDRWSQTLRDQRFRFKDDIRDRHMYVIAVGGDQPRIKALPLIQQFQYIFDFVGAKFMGYLIGQGNEPGDILTDERALWEATQLNEDLRSEEAEELE